MSCPHTHGRLPRPGRSFPVFPEAGVIPLPGLPLLSKPVPAGSPAPAIGYCQELLSLEDHLVEHREATFLVRVTGDSMTGFGIQNGDLLVVDRALEPADRSIVVAVVDGEFIVKQLCRLPEGILLRACGQGHGDILVTHEQELSIWGVVRWSIHRV